VFEWLFRNRQTGEITIGQRPNVSIIVFAVAWVVRRIFEPSGVVGTMLDVVVTGALVFWALDELLRGVNPWRRILGATVLIFVVVGLVRR
jgi:ABC-type branched-subunit amino acid transport system permease subunit